MLYLLLGLLFFCHEINIAQSLLQSLLDENNLFGVSPRTDMNFMEMCKYDGYECEEYTVDTTDGYILTVHRVKAHQSCPKNVTQKIMLFAPGVFLSSVDCLIPGKSRAICYIFSEACVDMWALNPRGNIYSRRHKWLNPDKDAAFWKFSFYEMGVYDLPAVIDFILDKTSQTQLYFIGISQGATMMIILGAENPEYNNKVTMGFGLSPTVFMQHSRFIVLKLDEVFAPLLVYTTETGLRQEIFRHGGISQTGAKLICGLTTLTYPLCSNIMFVLLGYDEYQIAEEVLPVVVSHVPAGTSVQTHAHWGQWLNNAELRRFDYGSKEKNQVAYGQDKPPRIDLSKITLLWKFFTSPNDYVADIRDVKKLADTIDNATLCEVKFKLWAHLDFVFGKDINKYVTPPIIEYFETGKFSC